MPSTKTKKSKRSRIIRMTMEDIKESRRKRPLMPGELTAKQLANIRDEYIDYSDIPPLDEQFFKLAKMLTPGKKRAVTFRIDEEVYQWLKSQGAGYQSRVNALLKAMMLTSPSAKKC